MNLGHGWRFALLGFPVRVDLSFWIVAALLAARRPLDLLLVWVGVVFVSVLVHELGHAVVARRLALRPRIELYSMGGLTSFEQPRPLTPGRGIALSLAGPAFGFALGGLVLAGERLLPLDTPYHAGVVVRDLVWVNFGWGLINLLPLLPLDGGNVMRRLIEVAKRGPDEALALRVSIAVAAVAALWAFSSQLYLASFLGAYFCYANYQQYRSLEALRTSRASG
jgi:Zn-dependent protease